jgi:hypothetical protein
LSDCWKPSKENVVKTPQILVAGLMAVVSLAAVPSSTPRVVRYCTNCATVEAVRVIPVKGEGTLPGAGLGGKRTERYEVVIRYTNGGAARTIGYENDPGLRVGEKVKVNDGVLTRDR